MRLVSVILLCLRGLRLAGLTPLFPLILGSTGANENTFLQVHTKQMHF